MDTLNAASSVGLELPSLAFIAGAILFSIIGFAAYRYGKKLSLAGPRWIGLALMLYSYVTPETWMMYAVGIGLCVALYYFRK